MPIFKEKHKKHKEYLIQLDAMRKQIEKDGKLHSFIEQGWFIATGTVRINTEKWLLAIDNEIERINNILEAIYQGEEIIVENKTVFSSFE